MPKKSLAIIPFILIVLILASCGDKYEGDFSYEVKDFSFTDQDGKTFSKDDLDGKFWVADFVFTNCTSVCPPMTVNMTKLQKELHKADLDDVQLVSFTVDPKHDKPEDLKKYAKERGGKFNNWHLLTGYDFNTIKKLSVKSFKSALEQIPDSDQFTHTNRFFIVSPDGDAIKGYDGTKGNVAEKVVKAIQDLK